jgi:phosphoribosylamine---glycine ligase
LKDVLTVKILVIGSGGREHALAWKLAQSPKATAILCAPGNAGTHTEPKCENRPVSAEALADLLELAKKERVDLTVVGPDNPLAMGIVDLFQKKGMRIFGPNQKAAQFEASKVFTKDFLKKHGIAAAASESFTDSVAAYDYAKKHSGKTLVIKADGLALGKGVIIARNAEDACRAIYNMMDAKLFGAAGEKILIEEFLEGEEASIHALIDGSSYKLFPAAQDHKRIGEGDTGPNTGGMGTYSPPPLMTEARMKEVEEKILRPFLEGCRAEGIEYRGTLFPGLMVTREGIKVLEFNARFGDPETQSLLLRLDSDLADLLNATVDGTLKSAEMKFQKDTAVCVVMAAEGYPGNVRKGDEIRGIGEVDGKNGVKIFHAGTKAEGKKILTSGGRVLGVTALGKDLTQARDRAYGAAAKISWPGAQFRKDIGAKGLK